VSAHLWKENNRLFHMANARLQGHEKEVTDALQETETTKLSQLGKTRGDYEKMVGDLKKNLSVIE